nr:gag pol polyprotein [Hymenolepis microstoma]
MSREADITISLATPTFDPEHPAIWFAQMENQIQLREIISKTPDNTSYDQLKEAVIKRFSVPKKKRLQQLFSQTELGDRSPTQLLKHMRSLASGCELQDEMLKELPYQDDLDKLAEVADRIHSRRERPSVQAVKISTDVDTLSQQVDTLFDQFKKLELLISGSSPRRNRQRSTAT